MTEKRGGGEFEFKFGTDFVPRAAASPNRTSSPPAFSPSKPTGVFGAFAAASQATPAAPAAAKPTGAFGAFAAATANQCEKGLLCDDILCTKAHPITRFTNVVIPPV